MASGNFDGIELSDEQLSGVVGGVWKSYTLTGDMTLNQLAAKLGVKVETLCSWNDIEDGTRDMVIKKGTTLKYNI